MVIMTDNEKTQEKFIIKSLLISTPNKITVDQLFSDYAKQEGHGFPFRKFGFSCFIDFLLSIPDTVTVCPYSPRYVTPVINENVKHINDLVLKQKVTSKKNVFNKKKMQVKKYWNTAPFPVPLTEISRMPNWKTETSRTSYATQSPYKLFTVNEYNQFAMQSFYSHAPDKSLTVPFPEISHVPNWKSETSRTSNATHSPYKQFPVNECNQIGMQSLDSHKSLDLQAPDKSSTDQKYPTSCEGPTIPLKSEQHSSNIQELLSQLDSVECTSLQNKRHLYHDLINTMQHSKILLDKCDGTYGSVKGDASENVDVCSSSSGVSSGSSTTCRMFSERALNNIRTLIKQNPQGIWCSEFPDVYKEYFGVMLEYRLYGYVSMIAVASAYPDIFHCVRRNSSDFLLFDARLPVPEHYTRNLNFDSYCPVITSLFRNNLQRMLVNFPYGLKSSKLWETYNKYFDQNITAYNFGFPNTEHLLQKLQEEEAIHLRQVGEDIMIYPHTSYLTKYEPALPLSPLSDFNIMTQEETTLLASLYPYETVDWTHTIPQQKWLLEQTHVPVLVSEVCSPSKFYLLLEGNQYYSALDSLMAEIQEFYVIEGDKYIMPKPTIREGQFCVCPYNDEWHRARICKTWPGKQKVEVFYIDFGTIGEVEIDLLRFMHYDFAKLPIQAMRASLANIKPFQGINWNTEANKLFLDLVFGKTLIAELEKILENGTVSVALVDTTGDDDIHINDMLVAEGYAEFERVFFPLTSPSVNGKNSMDQDYSFESESQITACSRNSSPAPCKGAGRGKIYLDSCFKRLKGIDYSGVQSVNKNVFPETFASICKSVNKTDRKVDSTLANNTWKDTLFENSSKHLRGDSTTLKTNKVDYCSNYNVSNTTTHTSITEATDFPSGLSRETSTLPFKSIWCNQVPNSSSNLLTTLPDFSTNETIPIPEVQIPPNTNDNQIDYSKTWSQNWNQVNPGVSSSWTNSPSNVYSQPHGDLTNTQNLLTSSVPPGLGWNGMPYSSSNMNSDSLHVQSPQVIEAFSKVILQQQQQQAFLQSIVTGLLKMYPSILNKSKEATFPPKCNISFPSDKPSVNITEVLTTPNPSLLNENIAYTPSTIDDSDHMAPNNGSIKSFASQSEENINKAIIVSEIDSIDSDKNVYDKVQMTYTENDKSMQLMRESYTEKNISNQLTDLFEEFSLNMSLDDQSTYPFLKDEVQNKRKVTANEDIILTQSYATADKGALKMVQEIVCHADGQDHSESKDCLTNENDSSSKAKVKPTRVIKKILIGEKFLNLINHYNEPYFCADEVICTFTKLSGTQVALKILGQNKSIEFVQACRDENIDLFKVLDSCDLNASCRKPNGKVHDIIHLISLETTLKLLKILKVSNETVLSEIEEEIISFNPNDEYWCPKPTLT